ncbi:MAG: (Na+)-NQR maturation NqrM [Myxococcota bacterium]
MELVLAVGLFATAMAGMSLGVIVSNRKLQSSCGGVAALDGAESSCGACGKKAAEMCPSDDDLVRLAQIAHPNPAHHH